MKNITALFKTRPLGACGVGLSLLIAQPCAAQKAACVNLLVGAGYAAWMGVYFDRNFYWSSNMPVGQYRCIDLPRSGMVDGSRYEVVVQAAGGASWVPCTPGPSPYMSGDTNSVAYNAWGTVFNVSCRMPGVAGESEWPPITPSKEGLEALEKWKKEGPQPAPQ